MHAETGAGDPATFSHRALPSLGGSWSLHVYHDLYRKSNASRRKLLDCNLFQGDTGGIFDCLPYMVPNWWPIPQGMGHVTCRPSAQLSRYIRRLASRFLAPSVEFPTPES